MNVRYRKLYDNSILSYLCDILLDWKGISTWIGARRIDGVLMWEGIVPVPIDINVWDDGQPMLNTEEDICVVSLSSGNSPKFHVVPCNDEHYFICERN